MYKYLENKNLINSQNYVINNDLKLSLLFDYFFKKEIGLFTINFINILMRFILLRIIKLFYKKINSWYINLIFHLILIAILSPILIFIPNISISIYIYFMIYLYISFLVLNLVADISLSKVNILEIRKKPENKYFKFSYINSIIENVDFSTKIFTNNLKIFLVSIFYTIISNILGYFIYLIIIKFYA